MLAGLDALHALCSGEGDRRRGWEFVHALTAAWGWPVIEGDGVDGSRLQAADDRIEVTLPAALREAYLLFGGRRDLTATQDCLVLPEHLRTDADGVLVFRVENQHCASWGVSAGAVGQDDPPVVVNVGDGWVPYSDRRSIALVEMVLSEAMFSAGEGNVDNRDMDEAASAALGVAFERLPLPHFPFWAGMDGPPIRWFAGPDVLLRDDGGTWPTWPPTPVGATRSAAPTNRP